MQLVLHHFPTIEKTIKKQIATIAFAKPNIQQFAVVIPPLSFVIKHSGIVNEDKSLLVIMPPKSKFKRATRSSIINQ